MTSKKLLALTGTVCLVVALLITSLLAGCGSQQANVSTTGSQPAQTQPAAKVIELNFNQYMPPTHMVYKAHEYFAQQIEKATNGRVKVTVYPTGTLTSGDKILDGLLSGVSTMAAFVPGWTPGRFFASGATAIPLPSQSGWVTVHVANDFMVHFTPQENNMIHPLLSTACGPYWMQTKKPVYKPEDAKGMIFRSAGDECLALIQSFGASGVGLAQGDVYESASKGIIDGNMAPPEVQKGFKQNEVFPHITHIPLSIGTPTLIGINLDTWNSLPKDIQDEIDQVGRDMVEVYAKAWWYIDIVGLEYAKQNGTEVIEISPDQVPAWKAVVAPLTQKYIDDKTKMGLPAADYVKYAQQQTDSWNSKHISADDCKKWVEANLVPLP